jgi:hypothetical protein
VHVTFCHAPPCVFDLVIGAVLPYLPAKRVMRYLSTRTAAAITLPAYPEPDPGSGSR